MLQLFFAVAFSAVPLTLYIPPVRSLNLFVETLEDLLRQTTLHTLRAYPRLRVAVTRLFHSFFRLPISRFLLLSDWFVIFDFEGLIATYCFHFQPELLGARNDFIACALKLVVYSVTHHWVNLEFLLPVGISDAYEDVLTL
ncbi:hypothetical protein ACFE04_003409 [Oxalis oulophora]